MYSISTKISMAKALITKRSPVYVQFFISSRCGLNCKMCNIVDANKDKAETSLSGIQSIARNLKRIGAGIVLLTGGEPFLRADIPEIVRILKSEKLDVRLQTHGFKTDRRLIEECAKNGAIDINISLDSLNEQLQDRISQVPGSMLCALETISYVSEIFPKKNKICALSCVVSRYNYREIPNLLKFATGIGWYLTISPVHISDAPNDYNFRSRDKSFAFGENDYAEVDDIINQIIAMKKQGYLLFNSVPYLESCKSFIHTGRPTWRNRKSGLCDSPNLYFAIQPNGDFAVCCDHDFPERVSLIDDKFPEIYHSEPFRKKVEAITSKCIGCQYGSYPQVTLSARNWQAFCEYLCDIFYRKPRKKIPHTLKSLLMTIKEIA